jgi:outer membrane protein OmpA-like peptidoglycan-associated protein
VKPYALAAVLVAVGFPALARASEAPYADAWDPNAVAAAEAAVARLAGKTHLAIQPSVLAIQGLTSGITASVQQVHQAMQDLGARETDLEVRVELPADVLFDFDRADIRADAAAALAQLATIIRAHPSRTTELIGHTDSRGDDAYNQTLSQRRAEAVKNWLVTREGLPASGLSTRGLGESQPIAANDTDRGRQRNRRVEAVIHKR